MSILQQYLRQRENPTKLTVANTKSKDCSTFTCFPSLPSELRLKIWRLACFHGRNVDVWTYDIAFKFGDDGDERDHNYFTSSCPQPIVLQCCRESRIEGLKHFKLAFGVSCKYKVRGRPKASFSCEPKIYINWFADTVCIVMGAMNDDGYFLDKLFEICDANGLRSIAFAVDMTRNDIFDGKAISGCQDLLTLRPWKCKAKELILFPQIRRGWHEDDLPGFSLPKILISEGKVITFRDSFKHFTPIKKTMDDAAKTVQNAIEEERLTRNPTPGTTEDSAVEAEDEMLKILVRDIVLHSVKGREAMAL
ncbi:hypothetical protein EG329_011204 [Mollisiaceae sp. DMI_Dod_QoI]|nr:hypothetical protein EG329_011204 [Helotiales sp. DMI_Dod_QoI]